MTEAWPFGDLPRGKYGAIYCDPPWAFNLWWGGRSNKTPAVREGEPVPDFFLSERKP